jgi:hypothetical protein
MAFFTSAIDTLKILVIALGAGLGAWGVINLIDTLRCVGCLLTEKMLS